MRVQIQVDVTENWWCGFSEPGLQRSAQHDAAERNGGEQIFESPAKRSKSMHTPAYLKVGLQTWRLSVIFLIGHILGYFKQ